MGREQDDVIPVEIISKSDNSIPMQQVADSLRFQETSRLRTEETIIMVEDTGIE